MPRVGGPRRAWGEARRDLSTRAGLETVLVMPSGSKIRVLIISSQLLPETASITAPAAT